MSGYYIKVEKVGHHTRVSAHGVFNPERYVREFRPWELLQAGRYAKKIADRFGFWIHDCTSGEIVYR